MLNEIEREIFEKIMKRYGIKPTHNVSVDKLQADYFPQGNFMICIITYDGDFFATGVAKRNPIDQFSNKIGMNKAFNEALKNIFVI